LSKQMKFPIDKRNM